MKVISANPILVDNRRVNSNDMYLSIDGADKKEVMSFQEYANSKGAGLVVDGIYDPKSKAAYKKYGADWEKQKATPVAVVNQTTGTTDAPVVAEPAPSPSYLTRALQKFSALSMTKKIAYVGIPVALLVVIAFSIKGKNK